MKLGKKFLPASRNLIHHSLPNLVLYLIVSTVQQRVIQGSIPHGARRIPTTNAQQNNFYQAIDLQSLIAFASGINARKLEDKNNYPYNPEQTYLLYLAFTKEMEL